MIKSSLFLLAVSLLLSGCYVHMGWGTPVMVENQVQQAPMQRQPIDSGYYREE